MATNKTDLEEKYFNLVWFARSIDPAMQNERDKVVEKYPVECARICGENGDWEHGFNSGMLACLRLVSHARVYHSKLDEFPLLDT